MKTTKSRILSAIWDEYCKTTLENHSENARTLVEFTYLLTQDLLCCNEDSVVFFRSALQEHIL